MTSKVTTVYNGRDNSIDLVLRKDEVPISADFVTGVSINVYTQKYGTLVANIEGRTGEPTAQPDCFVYGDVAVVPGSVSPVQIIRLKLGRAVPRIPPATYYWVEFIIYSLVDPHGYNWDQFPIAVVTESPSGV